jgi:hypothetical protein
MMERCLTAASIATVARKTMLALGLALAVAAVCAGLPREARADDESGVLVSRHRTFESPQNFAFELRLGPYHPRVDTAPELGTTGPYQTIFGTDMRWAVEAEFDWQAFRIPHVGTIGPGFSVGYTSSSAMAPFVTPVNGQTLSGETTTLTIYPMYGVAVLRIDVLSREMRIPFVPYAKAGIGWALWRASNSGGTSSAALKAPNGTTVGTAIVGEGHSVGTNLAVGVALDLNFLDRRASQGFDNATGVNHTFVFGELQDLNLNGLFQSNAMYVGNQNWVLGLGFEF